MVKLGGYTGTFVPINHGSRTTMYMGVLFKNESRKMT